MSDHEKHTTVLKIPFNYNHPIISGHALSFHPICAETNQTYFLLFSNYHSTSSARCTHEQYLLMDAATDELKQYTLADHLQKIFVGSFNNGRKNYGKGDGKPL